MLCQSFIPTNGFSERFRCIRNGSDFRASVQMTSANSGFDEPDLFRLTHSVAVGWHWCKLCKALAEQVG